MTFRALLLAAGTTLAILVMLHVAHALDLPDTNVTPGVWRSDLTVEQICSIRWGHDARAVTAAMKREVFARYRMTGNNDPACTPVKGANPHRRCEVDHLVSRELGGADDVANLWPQPYSPPSGWGATRKDRLENRLHVEVCNGTTPLAQARDEIRTDWIAAYRKRFGDQ